MGVSNTERLKQQLRAYQLDVVRWAEECIEIKRPDKRRIEPLILERHQRDWLRTATRRGGDGSGPLVHSVAVASWPKREGKSLCVAILVAHRMTCFTNQENVILANSERQAASVIFDELVGFFRNSEKLGAYTTEDDIQARRLAVPALGNETICVPCNYRTVQGMAVTGILATDELHAVQDIRSYNFLAGQTEALDAQVAISSQAGPPVQGNPVWRLYEARNEPHIFFNYSQEHIAPWAIALAEKQRVTLLPAEFDYLHRNAWAGTGYKLFPSNSVMRAAMDYKEPRSKEEWKALRKAWGFEKWGCAIGVGLDRAGVSSRGDNSVWSAIARFDPPKARGSSEMIPPADPPLGEAELRRSATPESEGGEPPGGLGSIYRQVMCDVMPTGSEAEVLEARDRTIEIFGPPDVGSFESYGCSDVVEKVEKAELVVPTIPRQRAMFNTFGRLLKEGRFGFAEDAGWDRENERSGMLKTELIGFEYDARSGGALRFGTQSGLHDDTIYSAGWTIDGLQGVPARGEAPYMGIL
jgi:hypothetical protein